MHTQAALDTSVLITALRSSTGAAAETVRLALRGELTTLMDYKLACEYRDVALRAEHLHVSGKSRAETVSIMDALEAVAEPVFVAFQYCPLSPMQMTIWFWMWQSTAMPTRSLPTTRNIFAKQQSAFIWKCSLPPSY
jgi:hypothetical protein